MLHSFARSVACALVAACALLTAGSASARSRRQVYLRVDVRTGNVEALSNLVPPGPAPPWPVPAADQRRITSDKRTVLVYEAEPPASKLVWQFTLPGSGDGHTPWEVLQGKTAVFAWREAVPGQRYQYRDIARAVDMDSGTVLWERVDPAHDPPGAVAVGTDYLVVDQQPDVLVLESRTGRVVRRFAQSSEAFAVATPTPGRVWVEAASVIECLDERTMKTVWRRAKQGALRGLLPIPGSSDWLVKTTSHTYRWRSDGRDVWAVRSTSESRPLLLGDRIYEGALLVESPRERARIALIARDVRTGKVIREYALGRHDMFFDQASVAVIEARDGGVTVAADFVVLD